MSGLVTGKYRAAWEEKIRMEIDRHRLIDPNADVKKIIERTIRQEIEKKKLKLERLLSSDELGKDEEIEILFIESVINDLLPELEAILKRNC
jgi:hypothetical protein